MGKKRCHSAEIERVGIIDVQPVRGLLSLSLPPYILYIYCIHVICHVHMYHTCMYHVSAYHNHCHLFVITGVLASTLVHDMYTGPGIKIL